MNNMNNKKEISDEALARYISGVSSTDEEARVLDFMAESDENVDDLLNIADAVRIQHEYEQRSGTLMNADDGRKKTRRFVLRPLYWAAASLLVAVSILGLWRFGTRDSGPVVASATDSSKTEIISDSSRLNPRLSADEEGLLAENRGTAKQPSGEDDGMYEIHQDQNIMASQGTKAEALSLEVVTPRRSHEVCLRGDKVTFSWHSNGAKTELILFDDEMEMLRRIDVTGRESIDISTASLTDIDTLHWRIEASSPNGTVVKHEGSVQLYEKGSI